MQPAFGLVFFVDHLNFISLILIVSGKNNFEGNHIFIGRMGVMILKKTTNRIDALTFFDRYKSKVEGRNINSQTLLATDYINHFIEVHMLMNMLPTMPVCINDIRAWVPKSYQEHFKDSVFAEKDLAIEAYEHSPDEYRLPFEDVVTHMNDHILRTVSRIEPQLANENLGALQKIVDNYTPKMLEMIDKCSSIINGAKHLTHQDSIDHYFDDNEEKLDGEDLDQSTIDDLFG